MTPDQWIEAFRINIESLHSNLVQSIEAAAADREAIRRDGENIRQLAKRSLRLKVKVLTNWCESPNAIKGAWMRLTAA